MHKPYWYNNCNYGIIFQEEVQKKILTIYAKCTNDYLPAINEPTPPIDPIAYDRLKTLASVGFLFYRFCLRHMVDYRFLLVWYSLGLTPIK